MLPPEKIRHHQERYARNGFVVLEAAIDGETLGRLNAAIDAARDGFTSDGHRSVFSTGDQDRGRDERFFRSAETMEYFLEEDAVDEDGELLRPLERAINKLGHALHDHVPEIGTFARHPLIAQLLGALGQPQPQLWQTMVIFKQPGIGGAVRWHQDASYLHTTPPSVIGVWVALEDADRDNGCLLVAPGLHKGPLRERYRVDWAERDGRLETLDDTPWPADDQALALEVPAGSLVFFSDHLPHASAKNRSRRSRRALTLHYADAAAYWSDSNWLQRASLPAFLL